MISSIFRSGDLIELVIIGSEEKFIEIEKKQTYFSKLCDIIEEDKLKILMPMIGSSKTEVNLRSKAELHIFAKDAVYWCRGIIIEQYQEGDMFIAVIEPYTGFQKAQRRQYYHLGCNINILYQVLQEEELSHEPKWQRGLAVDISGGGLRFLSKESVEVGEYVLLEINLFQSKNTCFTVTAQILAAHKILNRVNTYEHKVQFVRIEEQAQEALIQFIFEQGRRNRKSEKG